MILLELSCNLPPSSNSIYVTDWIQHRRILSEDAKKYKAYFKQNFHDHHILETAKFKRELPYKLSIIFIMDVVNKGWPGKAQHRFKQSDASNRVKILEDCLAEALGIDDSQFTDVLIHKVQATDNQPSMVYLQVSDSTWNESLTVQQIWNRSQKKPGLATLLKIRGKPV